MGLHVQRFGKRIRPYVDAELHAAGFSDSQGQHAECFRHLERAHVLGQASTVEHVRVHFNMLLWAIRRKQVGEVLGQIFRIVGAATKTAFGLIPHGNTGGSNVSPFRSMPVPSDLADIISSARKTAP